MSMRERNKILAALALAALGLMAACGGGHEEHPQGITVSCILNRLPTGYYVSYVQEAGYLRVNMLTVDGEEFEALVTDIPETMWLINARAECSGNGIGLVCAYLQIEDVCKGCR